MNTATLVPLAGLAVVLALLSRAAQARGQKFFAAHPSAIVLLALLLSSFFCLIAWWKGALSVPLALLVLTYTAVPTLAAYFGRSIPPPAWLDLAIIVWLWLPLELGAGAAWIPRASQGLLHTVAYVISVLLALSVFLLFRRLSGIKYQLPGSRRDWVCPLTGFLIAAPLLIVVGLSTGFLQPFHVPPNFSGWKFAGLFAVILFATALPEELLFRGLLQNWLVQRLPNRIVAIVLTGMIFGAAHLNNGPGPLPNWRYLAVATIAGVIYGMVFDKASSVFSSAALHAIVNAIKHTFF